VCRYLANRASAAGARFAGAPCARSFYATGPAHKRNRALLSRARQPQALVRWPLMNHACFRRMPRTSQKSQERAVASAAGMGSHTAATASNE